jgi:threonine synthase
MFLSHLQCSRCGRKHDTDVVQTVCRDCASVLFARYDLDDVAEQVSKQLFQSRPSSMWRYRELLPVKDESNVVTLGEGFTPIIHFQRAGKRLGLKNLFLKDDGLIPTGTFKARGMSTAISRCLELGVRKVAVATAGNAGAAMAAYASKAGLESHVYMPKDTPDPVRLECQIYGANLTFVDGSISDAGKMVDEAAKRNGWMALSTMKEPYRVEGKKTMGFEIAEQFQWSLPDVIVYPTGGGTGIVGMWKAFDELKRTGLMSGKLPRMVSVQSTTCAPVVKAIEEGKESCEFWKNPATVASGLRVPKAFGDYLIIRAINESHGTALAVSDEDMLNAMKDAARKEGVWMCPEGAATFASLPQLVRSGFLEGDETVLLYNTGSGVLYPNLV